MESTSSINLRIPSFIFVMSISSTIKLFINGVQDTGTTITRAMEEGRLSEDVELGLQYPTQLMEVVEATAIPIQPSSKPVSVRAFPLATYDI